MSGARSIRVRGIVQGVGFRPFVFRLARAHALAGWVLNEPEGVDIHLEGAEEALEIFVRDLTAQAPAAAQITAVEVHPAEHSGFQDFTIRESVLNQNGLFPRASRPIFRSAKIASPSCSIQPIRVTSTRTSTAPTAVRATP